MIITVNLGNRKYDITVKKDSLSDAGKYFNLNRKVLIVTDSGMPSEYAKCVEKSCKEAITVTVPSGEKSKSLNTFGLLLETMLKNNFTRTDAVVAVGGGVVGDLSGFVAASYMRGIDFYNIPTTLLSQLDSSIGGKTAINLLDVKNCVGAFYQPKGVLIDVSTLKTLDRRQFMSGLAEAIKMAATSDSELFSEIEHADADEIENIIENIIIKSVNIKKSVVEQDEHEGGIRRILNFGHTVGHAVESRAKTLYHGECVGIGMLYTSKKSAHERIQKVLEKYGLPTQPPCDINDVKNLIYHDKKSDGDEINIVYVDEIGKYRISREKLSSFVNSIGDVK